MTITSVYVFVNGMAIVFDEEGKQLPEYQGVWEEVKDKILRDATQKFRLMTDVPFRFNILPRYYE